MSVVAEADGPYHVVRSSSCTRDLRLVFLVGCCNARIATLQTACGEANCFVHSTVWDRSSVDGAHTAGLW